MSSSKSSSNSSSTWRRLLEDKQAEFKKYGIEPSNEVKDEASFRLHFEDLCRTIKEKHYTKMLVQLRFGPINSFASAVDALERFTAPYNLAALISTSVFVAIRTACDAGLKLFRIVELLGELHSAIPQVGANIHQVPNNASIHTPLYKIFTRYMDCLLLIISNVNSGQPSGSLDHSIHIEKSITDAAQLFKREGETFHHITERAGENEAIETRQYTFNVPSHAGSSGDESTARFKVLRLLGRGSGGEVHEVKEITTGEVYARKHMRIGGDNDNTSRTEKQVQNEVDIMKKLVHTHIVSVLFPLKGPGTYSIFMQPSADSNLRVYLDKCCKDGYLENALEAITPWFGCLHTMTMASDYSECGTLVYRAPEVTAENPPGPPADIFSLGCVFSEILTVYSKRSLTDYQEWREDPEIEFSVMFRANLKKVRDWVSNLEGNESLVDPISYLLIKRMLNEQPTQRYTAEQLWNWLLNDNSGVKLYCDYH